MKIKRYFAADMRRAISKVRQDLGEDAVILSNRKVDGGVEIVAAVDYDEALVTNSNEASTEQGLPRDRGTPAPMSGSTAAPAASQFSQAAAEALAPTPETTSQTATAAEYAKPANTEVVWAQDPALVAMRKEIQDLRGLLEHEMAHLAWGKFSRNKPSRAELLRRLTAMGLQTDHAQHIAKRAGDAEDPEQGWRDALDILSNELPVMDEDILSEGGVIALVGPTGVGKTTTIAKLAARFALQEGQRSVALISTDSYRIGAYEQLLTYGRILGAPVQVAGDTKELDFALQNLADKKLILIDTAGMSQRDMRLSEQLSTLKSTGLPIKIFLTLSATSQTPVLDEAVSQFRRIPLQGCVLTKQDEAASLGGAISVITRHRLSLAFVGDGQRVPEDLHPARAHNLIAKAQELMQAKGGRAEEMELANRFGGEVAHGHV